ncbi:hypothetical protein FJ250_11600 [bacterium]|nr:hypothetical protein [bacterium]
MARTTIADLDHFLDQGAFAPDLPPRALSLARHLAAIVAWVTHSLAVGPQLTNVACRCRPGRRPCPGDIVADHDRVSDLIYWQCPSCGDGGSIGGWRGTRWDCGMTVRAAADSVAAVATPDGSVPATAATVTLTFTIGEKALLEKVVNDFTLVTRLAVRPDGSQWSGAYALAELDHMTDDLALVIDDTHAPGLRRALARLLERLEMIQVGARGHGARDRPN